MHPPPMESSCRRFVIRAAVLAAPDVYSKELWKTATQTHILTKTRQQAISCFVAQWREAMCAFSLTRSGRCGNIVLQKACLLPTPERYLAAYGWARCRQHIETARFS